MASQKHRLRHLTFYVSCPGFLAALPYPPRRGPQEEALQRGMQQEEALRRHMPRKKALRRRVQQE